MATSGAAQTVVRREVLPNASQLIVEQVPGATEMVVVLTLSTEGDEDTPATYGWRHLLEHVIARGPDGNLDQRVERAGQFLIPTTLRDATRFELRAGPGELALALGFLTEVMGPVQATEATLATELRVLEEELALVPARTWATIAAWRKVYGPRRLDPLGQIASMARATPDDLDRLRAGLFSSSHMTLTVVGPDPVEEVQRTARAWLAQVPPPRFAETRAAADPMPELPPLPSTLASAAALPVEAWDDPVAAARLGAALALADRAPDLDVTYTPARGDGLVVITAPADVNLTEVLAVPESEVAYRAQQAKTRLQGWLAFQMGTLERRAQFRGLLGALSRRGRPERLAEVFATVTPAQLAQAVRDWGQRAVRP